MSAERRAELVSVPLPDADQDLIGAWYPAAGGTEAVVLLHLHGKGGNCYSGPGRFVPLLDGRQEYAHLALNMRCHDLGYTRYDLPMPDVQQGVIAVGGGMWERLEDGVPDILAGVRWLREQGYRRIVLVGHSSGAYFAAEACAKHHDVADGLVLLSTVISYKRNLHSWFPGDGELDAAIARARELVDRGDGHALLPIQAWYYAISAVSLLERIAEPDGIFAGWLATSITPVMFGCGGQESREAQWRELHDHAAATTKRWLVLPGVSHDYSGAEQRLTDEIFAFAAEVA